MVPRAPAVPTTSVPRGAVALGGSASGAGAGEGDAGHGAQGSVVLSRALQPLAPGRAGRLWHPKLPKRSLLAQRKHLALSSIKPGQQIIPSTPICPTALLSGSKPPALGDASNSCLILFVGWRVATAAEITGLERATAKLGLNV